MSVCPVFFFFFLQKVTNEKEPGSLDITLCHTSQLSAVWLKFADFNPPSQHSHYRSTRAPIPLQSSLLHNK